MKKKLGILLAAVMALSVFSTTPLPSVKADEEETESLAEKMEVCNDNGIVSATIGATPMQLNSTVEVQVASVPVLSEDSEEPSYSGTLAHAFSFNTATSNSYYKFTYSNPYFKNTINFALYDQNKMKMNFQGSSVSIGQSESKTMTIKLDASKTYYVIAYTENGENFTPSNVAITIESSPDLAGDTREEAKSVNLGDTTAAALDGFSDVDFYKFTTTQERAFYQIDLINISVPNLSVEVYDADAQEIKNTSVASNSSQTVYMDLKAESTYFVKVFSPDYEGVGSYKMTVLQTVDDVNDTTSTAMDMKLGNECAYSLQSDTDIDVFKFTVKYPSISVKITNNSDVSGLNVSMLDSLSNQISTTAAEARTSAIAQKSDCVPGSVYYLSVSGKKDIKYALTVSYDTQSITYELNGGENNELNPVSYYVGTAVKLQAPTRKGYSFVDWYTTEEMSEGSEFKGIATTDNKPVVVYAKWKKKVANPPSDVKFTKTKKINQVKITFKKGSGTYGTEIKYAKKKNMKGAKKVTTTGSKAVLKKFKFGKTFYVQIRGYFDDDAGRVWSKKSIYKIKINL